MLEFLAIIADEHRKAAVFQRAIHALLDAGHDVPNWRYHALPEGFTFGPKPDHGMGIFALDPTGEVCEWQGAWSPDGDVLLCIRCHTDGT